MGSASPYADQGGQPVPSVIGGDHMGHVPDPAVDLHAMRLVAARAENRSAGRENARKSRLGELDRPVLGEAEEPVAKTHDLPVVLAYGCFSDGPDGGIQPRAVAARRQDPYAQRWLAFHERQLNGGGARGP